MNKFEPVRAGGWTAKFPFNASNDNNCFLLMEHLTHDLVVLDSILTGHLLLTKV